MRPAARALVLLATALATAGAVVGVPLAAAASEGSVPADVRAYVTGGDLVVRLDEVYGLNAAGEGIDFDDTTTPGPISRIWHVTDARLAGDADAPPTAMANEWSVPISVAEQPVGVAVVWINPEIDAPELAEFLPDPDAAVALTTVPDDAQLVRVPTASAWFALAGETLTPLVAGESGITEPVAVADADLAGPAADPVATADDGSGLVVAIIAVVLLLAIVVAGLLLPRWLGGRRIAPPET